MSKGSKEAAGHEDADSFLSADIVDLVNLEDDTDDDLDEDPRSSTAATATAHAAAPTQTHAAAQTQAQAAETGSSSESQKAHKRRARRSTLLITASRELRAQHARAVAVAESILRQLGQAE